MKATTTGVVDQLNEFIRDQEPNIGQSERMLSTGAGAFVLYTGVTNLFDSPLTALAEIGIGGLLLFRGLSGYCPVKQAIEGNARKDVTIIEHRIVEPAR
jgi:hypothetical protein